MMPIGVEPIQVMPIRPMRIVIGIGMGHQRL